MLSLCTTDPCEVMNQNTITKKTLAYPIRGMRDQYRYYVNKETEKKNEILTETDTKTYTPTTKKTRNYAVGSSNIFVLRSSTYLTLSLLCRSRKQLMALITIVWRTSSKKRDVMVPKFLCCVIIFLMLLPNNFIAIIPIYGVIAHR